MMPSFHLNNNADVHIRLITVSLVYVKLFPNIWNEYEDMILYIDGLDVILSIFWKIQIHI